MILAVCQFFNNYATGKSIDPPPPRVRVTATGQAPSDLPNAREAAVEDALRRCVEAGGGVELASVTESRDFMIVSDVIYTRTAGYVQKYEVLEEHPDQNGLYTVRVSAIIMTGDLNTDLEAFKSLLKRKGNPRILIVGSADNEELDFLIAAQLQGMLEERGLRVIDKGVLTQQQRTSALRAIAADKDSVKAALIAKQNGADILAIVRIESEVLPAETIYGQEQTPVDAIAVVKLIRADTAEVLGSIVQEVTATGTNAKRAQRQARSEVAKNSMTDALKRISSHWLSDVDARGGQEIAIVLHKFSFSRTTKLVQSLRKIDGVKSVVVDRTDVRSTGQLRVTTNASAADIAAILIKLDQELQVIHSSGNKVEVE